MAHFQSQLALRLLLMAMAAHSPLQQGSVQVVGQSNCSVAQVLVALVVTSPLRPVRAKAMAAP